MTSPTNKVIDREEEHPTTSQAPVEKLNILRDALMSKVISQLDGELNPRPAYNSSGVYFEHSRFCENCLDKVITAILDGLRKDTAPAEKDGNVLSEENVITPDNARLAAKAFLDKLNLRVNDHVSLEFFNRQGMKKCLESDVFGGLPYEVARVVDHYGHDGKHAISEKLLGQHAYAATRSTGIVYDEKNQDPITKFSDHSGLTVGEVLSSAIGNKRCSCMQSEKFKDNERKDVEELANLVKDAEYNTTPYNGYTTVAFNKTEYFSDAEVDDEDEGSIFNSDSEEDSDSEEEEPTADGTKCRIVNDNYRPSRSVKAKSERGDAPPLCLSICRHFDGNDCPFNAENKRKIFNAINFIKQKEGEVAFINGDRHKMELCTFPSFAIGSSVYEVLVYDHDPLTAASVSSSNKNAPDDVKYDHATNMIRAVETVSKWDEGMSDVAGALCDQIFAKPCAKAYLTVTTAAVPWPCILKTPPMSDVNSEGKYGSFRSFVVPLPCSYGGRRLNDSTNGWRSRIYTNFVEDFVKRSVRPIPKGRLLDLSERTWSFTTRNVTHHQLKVFGSVLRSECGDMDASPLEYKTSLCSRDAIEAQSDFSKLRRLLDVCNKDLDTFTDGPYREATIRMTNIIASENETEQEEDVRNEQFEEQHRRVVLLSELATKQNNFKLQLERQLNNLSYLCASFVPGF